MTYFFILASVQEFKIKIYICNRQVVVDKKYKKKINTLQNKSST